QRKAREIGNSVFVDKGLRPYDDQWAYLSSLPRLSPDAASSIVDEAELSGRVLGVRMPVDDEQADEPWKMSPSRRSAPRRIEAAIPQSIKMVVADQVYIDRTELPPAVIAQLIRLAAFQNPEFYRAQAMRLPTFGKPRVVSCAELYAQHVALPRGCLEEAIDLVKSHGAVADLKDLREIGTALPANVSFQGESRRPASGNIARRRTAGRHYAERHSDKSLTPRNLALRIISAPSGNVSSGRSRATLPRSCSHIVLAW